MRPTSHHREATESSGYHHHHLPHHYDHHHLHRHRAPPLSCFVWDSLKNHTHFSHMDPNQHDKMLASGCKLPRRNCFLFCNMQEPIKHFYPTEFLGTEKFLYRLINACMHCWHYPLEPTLSCLFRRRHCDVATNLTSPTSNRVKRPPMFGDVGHVIVGTRKGT